MQGDQKATTHGGALLDDLCGNLGLTPDSYSLEVSLLELVDELLLAESFLDLLDGVSLALQQIDRSRVDVLEQEDLDRRIDDGEGGERFPLLLGESRGGTARAILS